MKKNIITNGLFTALILTSAVVGADQKYPASDFQPSVVYQDKDYIAKSDQSTSTAPSAGASQQVDPKYPAANFQPTVVYNDPAYKHSSTTNVGSVNASGNEASDTSVATAAGSSEKKADDSSYSFLLGLILFAAVGFVFFSKRPQSKPQSSTRVYTNEAAGGLTGVAKYLNRKSGTGVARYLEKQVKTASVSAATGVAKYMAKQSGSASETKTAAKTGVDKYLRNRG